VFPKFRVSVGRSYKAFGTWGRAIRERRKVSLELEELTGRIIECGIRVHKELGPGFLESIYQTALPMELNKNGLNVETQKKVYVFYD